MLIEYRVGSVFMGGFQRISFDIKLFTSISRRRKNLKCVCFSLVAKINLRKKMITKKEEKGGFANPDSFDYTGTNLWTPPRSAPPAA